MVKNVTKNEITIEIITIPVTFISKQWWKYLSGDYVMEGIKTGFRSPFQG